MFGLRITGNERGRINVRADIEPDLINYEYLKKGKIAFDSLESFRVRI